MKKYIQVACLMLAIGYVFCACGKPPQSSGQDTTVISAVSDDSAGNGGSFSAKEKEAWQIAFAEVATHNLYNDSQMKPETMRLYYNGDEVPLLVLRYDYTSNEGNWWKAWKYENDEAVLVYEGEGRVDGISVETGNPVVMTQTSVGELYTNNYVEHYLEQETPLLEIQYGNGDYFQGSGTVYRSHIDGSSWTASDDPYREQFSKIISQQQELLPLTHFSGAYADFDVTEKVREFLGMSDWQPAVPANAPQWVSEYISLIHNHLFMSYTPDKACSTLEEGLGTKITLLEPPEAGKAPILEGSFVSPSFLIDGSVQVYPVKNRMLFLWEGLDSDNSFYKDAQGRYIICRANYTDYVWGIIGEYDLTPLFRSGYNFAEPSGYAYLDNEYFEFDIDEKVELVWQWLKNKETEKLGQLGYGELFEWPGVEIQLPETASWNEMEAILVEKFCSYAQQLGQM